MFGAVLAADPLRQLVGGVLRAKGTGAGKVARVGAAADRERLALAAGVLGVGVEKGVDLRALGADVEGLLAAPGLVGAAVGGRQLGEAGSDLLGRGGGGEARVHGLREAAVHGAHNARHEREVAKLVVGGGDAGGAAVGVLGDGHEQLEEAALALACEVAGK